MVSFNKIPTGNLVPGAYAEFDKSAALQGTPTKPQRAALIGIVPTSSTIDKDTPIEVTSGAQVLEKAGASQLATIAEAFMRVKRDIPIDIFAVEADSAGAKATGHVQFSGTATADGTIELYVNGILLTVTVSNGDTAVDVATAAKDKVETARKGTYKWLMPFTAATADLNASGSSDATQLTADEEGAHGNDHSIAVGSKIPAGLTVTVSDFSSGSGSDDLANTISAFGDTDYSTIVTGINDTTNLGKLETEMENRWGPMDGRDGIFFYGFKGTHSDLTTHAGNVNDEFACAMGSGQSQTPPWVWGAQAAAQDAIMGFSPRPRFGRSLPDCKPPSRDNRFDRDERQTLLDEGISTFRVTPGGSIVTERLITTYTQDPLTSTPDPVFRNVSTMRNLSYLRWSWTLLLEQKYGVYNLADDGTQFAPGTKVATPSVIRGEALSWFRNNESNGRVEGFEQFKQALVVERDSNDVERVNVLSPPDLINELVTIATRFAFRL